MKCNPYLTFNGNCREAFSFYEQVLRGKVIAMMAYEETPAAGKTDPDWLGKIIHARLLFDGNVLMASDSHGQHYEAMKGMSVTLSLDTPEEAERVFKALSEGAQVQMDLQETFWAVRFGMLTDRFGTPWMINCEKKQ